MASYDSEDTEVASRLHNLDQQILSEVKHFHNKYVGRKVRLTQGWRKGEKGALARIDGVIFYEGRLLFLCMALNKKGEVINGAAWTREYRSITAFDFVEEAPNAH